MKLENTFTVPVPRADAWKVLLDVERIAPCMPGATLTSRDGDSFTGTVKVKVGPINLTYGGQARFVSLDEAAGVAVIEGSGKETRGTGTAKALITCTLVDHGSSTDVQVETDLNVTGKPAQFGRGVLADVSAKLVDRFAACLSEEITAGDGAAAGAQGGPAVDGAAGAEAAGDGPPAAASEAEATPPVGVGAGPAFSVGDGQPVAPARAVREAEPIDLMETAGLPVLKRAAPAAGALVVLLLAYLLGWRRGAKAVSAAAREQHAGG